MADPRPAPERVIDFLGDHNDPKTLPKRIIEVTPAPMLGYVATAYLAGVEVGRRAEWAEHNTARADDAG